MLLMFSIERREVTISAVLEPPLQYGQCLDLTNSWLGSPLDLRYSSLNGFSLFTCIYPRQP